MSHPHRDDDVELDTLSASRPPSLEHQRPISPPPSYPGEQRTSSPERSVAFDADEPEDGAGVSALPPTDRGWRAWSFLGGAFVIELMVWGPPFAFGAFLNGYRSEFGDSSLLPLIGSISSGLIYLLSLVVVPMFARYPRWRPQGMWLGLVLCIAGLVGASFAKTPMQLVLNQGVIYALGGCLLYFASSTFLWDWFVTRRGLANGLILSGTGLGGVVFPLLIEYLLSRYGRKTTLRVIAGMFAGSIPLVLPFVKSRLPAALVVGEKRISWGFVKSKVFWVIFAGNLVQGLGNFAPTLYLPTFASDIGLSSTSGTLCLSMLNLFSAFGLVFLGTLSDVNLSATLAISTLGSAASVFLVWGSAKSFGALMGFAIFFGSLAPSFSATWPSMISAMQTDPSQTLPLYSILVAGRGLGNVLTAPISSALLSKSAVGTAFEGAALAYGVNAGQYAPLILFTGTSMALSALISFYPWFRSPKAEGDGEGDRPIRREL